MSMQPNITLDHKTSQKVRRRAEKAGKEVADYLGEVIETMAFMSEITNGEISEYELSQVIEAIESKGFTPWQFVREAIANEVKAMA